MISYDGYHIGQKVRFQDSNFCWHEGEVVEIEYRRLTTVPPSGRMVEKKPMTLIVAHKDAFRHGKWTESRLPVKRVRPVEPKV
jgi:hypothetical protein